ncbi:SDR family NAD(P)-dependent oxidoreductase [Flavilitoribacter nigricans]|uniref:Short-chain dehydrogenase n=1 Tax=Flavilitoribacter nigricans (strain ATCC 23147 / DSM 23189 / NBRC 102662 / NCIMB 1420 / SS-2) TaxID=1122177 RepID=A0A2D0NH72_FLAN2|nr:SDR family oxidoreductase [Flavilitoribacter nigricans]PHN07842.1 short-chain dehydrogenase [Flavilitoribacter nigricans DSM 23189 = NBRC 102662]
MLEGKNILIIGGTSGMGWSAAAAFVAQGAKVVVTGIEEESCERAGIALGENGKVLLRDAREEGAAEAAIEVCRKQWGDLHGLFHVAGGSGRKYGDGPLHEMTLSGWNATFELNLSAMMLSNRAAVRTFLEQGGGGAILNMGSVLGESPSPAYFTTHAYAAAKSSVIGFTRSIAAYYARHNIRVNVIAPALTETPMARRAAENEEIMAFIRTKQPLDGGRIGQPQDTNAAAVLLLSDQAAFITGQVLRVDGGWTISEGQIPQP